ncbi:MAG: bacterial Ig-like domain-containing protein [Salinivirgaceae bacterium]|nr:bacterial Ig-like domain-containing protein [Salinivirgaceae bacterium]
MTVWKKIAATIVFALALFGTNTYAQPDEYQFTFEVGSRTVLDSLSQIISIDRVDGNRVWAYANADEMQLFARTDISFELCTSKSSAKAIPMAKLVSEMQNIDHYPTYEVYDTLMHNFVRDYPQLCQLEEVATLPSGRQILALKISKDVELNNTDKPEVLCTSTMHGDEGICATTALSFCRHLLENYGSDSYVSRLMDSIEFWVIPIMNPDGMYKGGNNSISGSTRSNGNSKDLNRNFPNVNGGSGTNQPEIVAMKDFFGRHHFTLSTNLHAGNECFNYPWDTWSRATADNDWWRLVGAAYRDTAQYYGSSGYFDDGCSNSANGLTNGYAWYSISGGQQDWANYFMHCREVTIEVCGTKEPTSTTTIANIWRYNKNSMLNFYAESLNGVRGIVTNAVGTPLAARITIAGHDKDNSWIETDARVGDYHRLLKAGTYNLTFEADGYLPQTIAVTVVDGKPTWRDVVLYKSAASALQTNVAHINISLPSKSQTTRQITIFNLGSLSTEYAINNLTVDWLSIDNRGGQLNSGMTDTLTATISSSRLGEGTHTSLLLLESVSQTITVDINLEVRDIPDEVGIADLPLKTVYSVGDTLDVNGGRVFLRYCNDSVAFRSITSQMVSGFSSATPGVKKLEVAVDTLILTFSVIVRDNISIIPEPVVIKSVSMQELPNKLTYKIGDTLDVTGGVLVVTYSDVTADTIAMKNAMIGGFNSKQAGTILLTVRYKSFTNMFSVRVIDPNAPVETPTIVSVELTSLPLKLEYKIGQIIDVGGGILTVTFSNDSTSAIALQSSMVRDFDSSKAGMQWVTIEYAGTFNMFCVDIIGNDDTTNIKLNTVTEPIIYAADGDIVIENADAPVMVYNLAGRCVAYRNSMTPVVRIAIGKRGIYIVRVGATAKKVGVSQQP